MDDQQEFIKMHIYIGGRNGNQVGPFQESLRRRNVKDNLVVEYVDVEVYNALAKFAYSLNQFKSLLFSFYCFYDCYITSTYEEIIGVHLI